MTCPPAGGADHLRESYGGPPQPWRRRKPRPTTGWILDPSAGPKHLFEKGERPWVLRLAEPEHRLFPHLGVAIVLRHVDQARDGLVAGQLAEREHGLALH